jgi:hypothetical protein
MFNGRQLHLRQLLPHISYRYEALDFRTDTLDHPCLNNSASTMRSGVAFRGPKTISVIEGGDNGSSAIRAIGTTRSRVALKSIFGI